MPLRVKNIAEGFWSVDGDGKRRFHPIRAASDYDPDRTGEEVSRVYTRGGVITKRGTKKKKTTAKKATAKKATTKRSKTAAKRGGLARRTTAKKATGRKKNPIPMNWVDARVRRKKNGDLQVMIPKRSR